MKVWIIIIGLLTSSVSFGQTSFLKDAVSKLDKALIEKDTTTLKQLLHKSVTYGHSSGWVETKEEVIKIILSGPMVYHKQACS